MQAVLPIARMNNSGDSYMHDFSKFYVENAAIHRTGILLGFRAAPARDEIKQRDRGIRFALGLFCLFALAFLPFFGPISAAGHKNEPPEFIIAVIDTGIDLNHPHLKDYIWTNPGETGLDDNGNDKATNGEDDDQNGYADDVQGWNFLGESGSARFVETREYERLIKKVMKHLSERETQRLKDLTDGYMRDGKNIADEFRNLLDKGAAHLPPDERNYLTKVRQMYEKKRDDIFGEAPNSDIEGLSEVELDEYKKNLHKFHSLQTYFSVPLRLNLKDPVGEKSSTDIIGNAQVDIPGNNRHGTAVASLIVSGTNNIRIMPLVIQPEGDERDKDVAKSIEYAVRNGAKIINMSFGKDLSPHNEKVAEAIAFAEQEGVLVVISAGNSSRNIDEERTYPNAYKEEGGNEKFGNCLMVGAVSTYNPSRKLQITESDSTGKDVDTFADGVIRPVRKLQIAEFSNIGKDVDIFADGVGRLASLDSQWQTATVPVKKFGNLSALMGHPVPNNRNLYVRMDGTSLAAPEVCRLAAILWQAYPEAEVQQIRQAILEGADSRKLGIVGKDDKEFDVCVANLSGAMEWLKKQFPEPAPLIGSNEGREMERASPVSEAKVKKETAPPPPPGGGSAGQAGNLVRSPHKSDGGSMPNQELSTVGGVNIDVTISTAALNPTSGTSSLQINRPVSVSFKHLLADLGRYEDRWQTLPNNLRYPGGIDRIYGFVLDEANNDLVLIGQKSEFGRGISIDDLITGIKTVWKNGLVPGCSLDPVPFDFSGPQYARVIAVHPASSFARTMLDADYEMKRLMTYGAADYGIVGYRSHSEIIADKYGYRDLEKSIHGRFWLCPKPLSESNTWISPDGKSVLFDAEVQVLSEDLIILRGGLVGTGEVDPSYYEAAKEFSRVLPRFETIIQGPDDRYIFRELHGLIDIVVFCTFLRKMHIQHPLLQRLASLPAHTLEGKEAAPPFYPDITYEIPGTTVITSGGVDIRSRIRSRIWQLRIQNNDAADLVAAASSSDDQTAREWDKPLLMQKSGGGDELKLETEFLKGSRFLSIGNYAKAEDTFANLLHLLPDDKDALAYLALAKIGLGDFERAKATIDLAFDEKTEDAFYLAIQTQLKQLMKIESVTQKRGKGGRMYEDLSNQYIRQSELLTSLKLYDAALEKAKLAVQSDRKNPQARKTVAQALIGMHRYDAAWKALLQARRLYRKRLRRNPGGEVVRKELAMVLSLSAAVRFGMNSRHEEDKYLRSGDLDEMTVNLERGIRDSEEAYELDPENPAVLVSSILGRWQKARIFDLTSGGGRYEGALNIANKLVENHPGLATGYAHRSLLHFAANQYEAAAKDVKQALDLTPSCGLAMIVRGKLFKRQGLYAEAIEALGKGAQIETAWRAYANPEIKECRRLMDSR